MDIELMNMLSQIIMYRNYPLYTFNHWILNAFDKYFPGSQVDITMVYKSYSHEE